MAGDDYTLDELAAMAEVLVPVEGSPGARFLRAGVAGGAPVLTWDEAAQACIDLVGDPEGDRYEELLMGPGIALMEDLSDTWPYVALEVVARRLVEMTTEC